jgi:hypothetical protein
MMKRTILIIALVAALAVPVFGSQALAVPPANLPTTQNILNFLLGMNDTITGIQGNVTHIKGELDDPNYGLEEIKAEVAAIEAEVDGMDAEFDGMAKMESYSGVVTISPDSCLPAVEDTYPEARHVILTVSLWNNYDTWAPPDSVYVFDHSVDGPNGGKPILMGVDMGYYTVEFVTKEWSIEVQYSSSHTQDLYLYYKYIVTYPG